LLGDRNELSWHIRCGTARRRLQESPVPWKLRDPLSLAVPLTLMVSLWPAEAAAQLPYPVPYPYGYHLAQPDSNLRLDISPREAMVYVDGYLAGTVDDFDGVFQRLHVMPGEHELTIYLQGYRSIRQRLYLSPNASRKITETMEKLGTGETNEPPPAPPEPPPADARPPEPRERYPFPGRGGQPHDADAPPAPRAPDSSSTVGSLVLRVQPADADVLIDGEKWRGPSGDERLVVQVSQGHHRVVVRKDGYMEFSTEVDVPAGGSLPVNVSLVRAKD
jgi:hypothetical protein